MTAPTLEMLQTFLNANPDVAQAMEKEAHERNRPDTPKEIAEIYRIEGWEVPPSYLRGE